jgi:ABC-type antimicrobial peptide transport system permease subunit
MAQPLRLLLAEMAPDLALANLRTIHDIVSEATASRRFVLVLLAAFAAIAVALCIVGIYGVISYQVGQRTREIGIRVALGASRGHVMRTIAGRAMMAVLAGIVVGAAGARGLSSVIASQLYQVSATDPRVYLVVVLFVAALAAAACWQPMRRALGLSPVAVLRTD